MRKLILIIKMLCMAGAYSVRAQRYDRGFDLKSSVFVENGTWMVGGQVAYSTHSNDNYHFLIIEDINSNGYRFSVSPLVCYAVKDNMSLGVRFAYGRDKLHVNTANLGIADIEINVKDYFTLNHDFTGMIVYRNYIPIGNSKRFALFNETQLALGLGEAKLINGSNPQSVVGSYEESLSLKLGLNPGLVAFVNDNLAVEVNVGMLGLQYNSVDQIHNQVYEGSRDATMINFKVNIFSIGFGMAYYF